MNGKTITCIGCFVILLSPLYAFQLGLSMQTSSGISLLYTKSSRFDPAAQGAYVFTAAGSIDLNETVAVQARLGLQTVRASLPSADLSYYPGFSGPGAGIALGVRTFSLDGPGGSSLQFRLWAGGDAFIVQYDDTLEYFLLPSLTLRPSMELVPPGDAFRFLIELPFVYTFRRDLEFSGSAGLLAGIKLRVSDAPASRGAAR